MILRPIPSVKRSDRKLWIGNSVDIEIESCMEIAYRVKKKKRKKVKKKDKENFVITEKLR